MSGCIFCNERLYKRIIAMSGEFYDTTRLTKVLILLIFASFWINKLLRSYAL